jgi:DNA-binding CsgD family transcriptional regulator
MNIKLFKELHKTYQQFSSFAQRALGKKSTIHSKENFQLDEYLKIYHSIDTYCYVIADSVNMEIIKAGGSFYKMLGYQPEEVVGKRYSFILKAYYLPDLIKLIKGGIDYFDYLYKQPPQNRPYIKANFTAEFKVKNRESIHILGQSIPILFNEEMQPIYFLNIITDISDLKPDKAFTHYILDTSDDNDIKKIKTKFKPSNQQNENPISASEKRVLLLMAEGRSSKQIADDLCLSEHTVKNHRKNMLKKMGCFSSAELIKTSLVNGWI